MGCIQARRQGIDTQLCRLEYRNHFCANLRRQCGLYHQPQWIQIVLGNPFKKRQLLFIEGWNRIENTSKALYFLRVKVGRMYALHHISRLATAFPSARWRDGNGPEQTDYVSVKNVVECVKTQSNTTCVRFVLVSSIGVDRTNAMPFLVLNLFGVLKNKKRGEDFLIASGLNYTILRPGRLTDGPYTSYDINTLVKATSGERRAVEVEKGDSLLPEETSRIVVADAAVASLRLTSPANQSYCMGTKEGDGPKDDLGKWEAVFNEANGR